jgi:radical SAM superfamily enzyme YgiQ (UPF0313 family)
MNTILDDSHIPNLPKKPRIALVSPPFSKLVYGDEYTIKSVTPCLGLFYLASFCEDLGEFRIFEGEFYDCNSHLIGEINKWNPDIVGVTTNTSTYPLCREIAQNVTSRYRFAGGPYSSFRVSESLADGFDIVFIGDAELGLRDFLSHRPLNEVRGCAYKESTETTVKRTMQGYIKDLDSIPFPEHSKVQRGLYKASPHREMREPFATMMTTRGCGFLCSFCLSANGGMNGGKYRERSVENVIEEVKLLKNNYGVESIQFWDDTFTMNRQRTIELARGLEPMNLTYVCNTRTDKIDADLAELLHRSGCRGIFFGVETGNEELLETEIRKGVTNQQVVDAVKLCRRFKLQATTSFILGSIDDTEDTMEDTIRFALDLDADFSLFNIYTAHPGTYGYHEAINRGVLDEYRVDTNCWKGEPAGVPTVCEAAPRIRLHILKAQAYIRFYRQKRSSFYDEIISMYEDELERLYIAAQHEEAAGKR